MATECTQEAIRRFLTERGGRVRSVDLIEHFRRVFPPDDDRRQKAAVRETFKSHVDAIAFVRVENGVRFVCLKKKYRQKCLPPPPPPPVADGGGGDELRVCVGGGGNGASRQCAEPSPIPGMTPPAHHHHHLTDNNNDDADRPEAVRRNDAALPSQRPGAGGLLRATPSPSGARSAAAQPAAVVSGYGNDAHVSSEKTTPEEKSPVEEKSPESANTADEFDMGNRWSSKSKKTKAIESPIITASDIIPQITVTDASPLPEASDGSMFILPGSERGATSTGTPYNGQQIHTHHHSRPDPRDATHTQAEVESVAPADESQENHVHVRTRHGNSGGSQDHRTQWGLPLADDDDVDGHDDDDGGGGGGDEGHLDLHSLSEGEECTTPRASRQNFIELMMHSSPQVRRTMALRHTASSRSDSDSASLVSSNADEDGPTVTLHPLEHEWMMCASDGEWDSMRCLLTSEPALVRKKDFVTGFNCLHWAAKQGKPELLALMVNFGKRHGVPVDVNARSSAGYTPLHLAAMHNHMEVVKLLVGAYDADVELRDYSGKKASQYLANGATVDIRDIIGAYGGSDSDTDTTDSREGVRWRFSRVIHPRLKPLRLLGHSASDVGDREGRPRLKPLRRMSSLSHMKPKLQKLRDRTSQVVHTSFREIGVRPFESRPKSNLSHGDVPAH